MCGNNILVLQIRLIIKMYYILSRMEILGILPSVVIFYSSAEIMFYKGTVNPHYYYK